MTRAFTLVELLVAMAVGAVVTAALGAVFYTVSSTSRAVEEDRRVFGATVEALGTIGRDLTCCLRLPLAGNVAMTVEPAQDGSGKVTLAFNAISARQNDMGDRVFRVERIGYRYERNPKSTAEMILVRQSQTLNTDGNFTAPLEETLLSPAEGLEIEVQDGDTWQTQWPRPGGTRALPSGARVRLSYRQGGAVKTLKTTVAIRAGLPM